jgi:hypothetical protein
MGRKISIAILACIFARTLGAQAAPARTAGWSASAGAMARTAEEASRLAAGKALESLLSGSGRDPLYAASYAQGFEKLNGALRLIASGVTEEGGAFRASCELSISQTGLFDAYHALYAPRARAALERASRLAVIGAGLMDLAAMGEGAAHSAEIAARAPGLAHVAFSAAFSIARSCPDSSALQNSGPGYEVLLKELRERKAAGAYENSDGAGDLLAIVALIDEGWDEQPYAAQEIAYLTERSSRLRSSIAAIDTMMKGMNVSSSLPGEAELLSALRAMALDDAFAVELEIAHPISRRLEAAEASLKAAEFLGDLARRLVLGEPSRLFALRYETPLKLDVMSNPASFMSGEDSSLRVESELWVEPGIFFSTAFDWSNVGLAIAQQEKLGQNLALGFGKDIVLGITLAWDWGRWIRTSEGPPLIAERVFSAGLILGGIDPSKKNLAWSVDLRYQLPPTMASLIVPAAVNIEAGFLLRASSLFVLEARAGLGWAQNEALPPATPLDEHLEQDFRYSARIGIRPLPPFTVLLGFEGLVSRDISGGLLSEPRSKARFTLAVSYSL